MNLEFGRFQERTHRVQFDNGVTLLIYENHSNPTVQLSAAWRAGQFLDPRDKPGLGYLTANMLTRGTRRKTKLEFAQILEDVGADFDISANRFLARADGHALSHDTQVLIDMLAEAIREPAFPTQELEKLKQQLVGKLKRQQENTGIRAYERFLQIIYRENSPFYKPPVEKRVASIESMTSNDLERFYEEHYGAEALVLVLVGDVDSAAIIAQVKDRLGDWSGRAPTVIDVERTTPHDGVQSEVVFMNEKANADILLGHAGQLRRTDPDYYAAFVANAALGQSSLSSRLGMRVRDQAGLTYGIISRFFEPGFADGPWAVSLTVNPENIEEAIRLTKETLNIFVEEGITDAEVDDEKSSFLGSFIVGLDTNAALASNILSMEVFGLGLRHLDALPNIVKSITRDEVNAAVKRYIHPDRLLTVIAGEYRQR